MIFKLIAVASLFASALSLTDPGPRQTEIADDDGDLNPQPLPPIVEDEFGLFFG